MRRFLKVGSLVALMTLSSVGLAPAVTAGQATVAATNAVAPHWIPVATPSPDNRGTGVHAENTTLDTSDPTAIGVHATAAAIDGAIINQVSCLSGSTCSLGQILSVLGLLTNSFAETNFSANFELVSDSPCAQNVDLRASLDGVLGTAALLLAAARAKGASYLFVERRNSAGTVLQHVTLIDENLNGTKEISSGLFDAKLERFHPSLPAAPVLTMLPGDHLYIEGKLRAEVQPVSAAFGVASALALFGYPSLSGPLDVFGQHLPDPGLTLTAKIRPPADTTAPVTTAARSGVLGANQWYRSDVDVSLQASDSPCGSGVATTEYRIGNGPWTPYTSPFKITVDGITTVQYRSTDVQHNVEATRSITVQIDRTPPTITGVSPRDTTYLHSAIVPIIWTATDAVSGVDSQHARLDGLLVPKQNVNLLFMSLGTHTFVVWARDRAGNVSEPRFTFRIVATIDSLVGATRRAHMLGWINNEGVYASLREQLTAARASLDRGDVEATRGQLQAFRHLLEAQRGKSINEIAYQLLATDTNFVLAHLPT